MPNNVIAQMQALIRQLQGALGGARFVRGGVTSAGAAGSGAGFTVVRNATGDYSVTFTTAYRSTPSVVVGTGDTGAAYWSKLHASTPVSATGFRVACINGSGTLVDGSFMFIAAG